MSKSDFLPRAPHDRSPSFSRRSLLAAAAGVPLLAITGCGGGGEAGVAAPLAAAIDSPAVAAAVAEVTVSAEAIAASPVRRWAMGFSRVPPRFDVQAQLLCLDTMRGRAEYVLMQEAVPWAELLAGVSPSALVDRDLMPLARYARALGLDIVYLPELTDGLGRGREPAGLLATGRSLVQAPVRQAFCDYLLAVARQLNPQILGLATETNAVRLLAPAPLYAAVVQAAAQCAAGLRATAYAGELMISVQVEVAWGAMPGQQGYEGIGADQRDFPAAQILGLSSYPYFAYPQPEDVPPDYYSRLVSTLPVPVMVVEGGWPSQSEPGRPTSADMQARYLTRQAALLDRVAARGLTQLMLADLDLSTLPSAQAAGMASFASLGVMDSGFGAKPALAVWESLRSRRLQR